MQTWLPPFAVTKFATDCRSAANSIARRFNHLVLTRLAQRDQQIYPSNPMTPKTSPGDVLIGTPFEAAPPAVQRNVVLSAQIALARRGLYHEEISGIYGPAMEFSLRAYQARTGLPVTGRLDLETIAAL